MSRIVPAEYIPTDQALQELVASDNEYRRLNADWEAAGGRAGDLKWLAASARVDVVGGWLTTAVDHCILPLLAVRREHGNWREYVIDSEHYRRGHGHLAVWTGTIERLELPTEEGWLAGAALCFRRSEFDSWRDMAIEALRPASERLWTVVQAAAWKSSRDADMAASMRDLGADSILHAEVAWATRNKNSDGLLGIGDALDALVQAARAGEINVFGRPAGQGDEVTLIGQEYWSGRTIRDDLGRGIVAATDPEAGGLGAPWWDRLRVRPADVQRRWPQRTDEAMAEVHSNVVPIEEVAEHAPIQANVANADEGDKVSSTLSTAAGTLAENIHVLRARRGAAVEIDDEAILGAMLHAAECRRDTFTVRAFVLEHESEIMGPSIDAKVRRLQRKFGTALKSTPA